MADTDEDLIDIVEVDDEPEIGAAKLAATEEPALAAGDDTDDTIADLKRQLAEERANVKAEREARDRLQQSAQGEIADSQYAQIVNALGAREANMANVKRSYSEAMSAGDYDKLADIQVELSNLQFDIRQLSEGKRALEDQAKRPRTEGRVEPATAAPEDILKNLDAKSADWLRQHPECLTDRKKNARMLAAHHEAMAEDIELNSPAYFRHIETKLGYTKDIEVPRSEPKTETRRAAPVTAAPAARDVSSSGNGRASVQLSREEREMAADLGLTIQEYGANKLKLIQAGQLKG